MNKQQKSTYYVIGRFGNRTPDKSNPQQKEYFAVPFRYDFMAELLTLISIHEQQAGRPVMGGKVTHVRKPTESEIRSTVMEGVELGVYDDPEKRIRQVMEGNWYVVEYDMVKGWSQLWPAEERGANRVRVLVNESTYE